MVDGSSETVMPPAAAGSGGSQKRTHGRGDSGAGGTAIPSLPALAPGPRQLGLLLRWLGLGRSGLRESHGRALAARREQEVPVAEGQAGRAAGRRSRTDRLGEGARDYRRRSRPSTGGSTGSRRWRCCRRSQAGRGQPPTLGRVEQA